MTFTSLYKPIPYVYAAPFHLILAIVEQRGAWPGQLVEQTLSLQSLVIQQCCQTCIGCGPDHMSIQQDTRSADRWCGTGNLP